MARISIADARKAGIDVPKAKCTVKGKPYPMFEAMCKAHGLPAPEREYRFDPLRRWRFDFAWPTHRVGVPIALEIDGGAWTQGRHTRGGGFIADMEKMNEAQLQSWIVLRCAPQQIENGAVFDLLKRALGV